MGLDSRSRSSRGGGVNVLFSVDGPSLISAELSANTRVRMCLWQGSQVQDKQCRTLKNGRLEQGVFDAGSTAWTLTLIAVPPPDILVPTVADVTLDFNASSPSVTLDRVRFQGQAATNNNGITVGVDTKNSGDLRVDGAFDSPQSHAAHVVIEQLGDGGGVVYDQTSESVSTFSVTQPVSEAGTSYRVTVSNPNEGLEPGPVFVKVTISWP